MVTHQLQVERATGKVRRPKTDVLPLCHATNQKCNVTVCLSVCLSRRHTHRDHHGAACDAASVHFGPTTRRTDVLIRRALRLFCSFLPCLLIVWSAHRLCIKLDFNVVGGIFIRFPIICNHKWRFYTQVAFNCYVHVWRVGVILVLTWDMIRVTTCLIELCQSDFCFFCQIWGHNCSLACR